MLAVASQQFAFPQATCEVVVHTQHDPATADKDFFVLTNIAYFIAKDLGHYQIFSFSWTNGIHSSVSQLRVNGPVLMSQMLFLG